MGITKAENFNAEEWWEKHIEKMRVIVEKEEKIRASSEFISWLENFTIKHPKFCDEDWQYSPEKLSESDHEGVNQLHLLYNVIGNYAQENFIYPEDTDAIDESYFIKYNGVGYEISQIHMLGVKTFCTRVNLNNENVFIDFEKILNNEKLKKSDAIKMELNKLSELVERLLEKNIPIEAIVETFNESIKK